jgi:hypothetical protein
MSLCATNASKVDAALLDDGVADTLASGNTSAGYQPSCFPLEARQRHVVQIATSMVDNANCHVSVYLRH